jgi:hypothetical protein
MQPLEQAIKRAAVLLANIQASRWEVIPRLEPAKAIREEEHFTIGMGISSEYFRRQVVNHALLRMQRGQHGFGRVPEPYELENTLTRVLGGLASRGVP